MAAAAPADGSRRVVRETALPRPPTKISEALRKYKPATDSRSLIDRHAAAAAARASVGTAATAASEAKDVDARRPAAAASASASSSSRHVIPSLSSIALQTIAANFEANPRIEGLPPEYTLAITSSLPLHLDVGVTAPHVQDEHYWKRVALEHKKWRSCRIEEHGLSWKQLVLERSLEDELESFGVYPGISAEFEQGQVRPPIDATHPLWRELYPKVRHAEDTPPEVAKAHPDFPVDSIGRPLRERFCKYGVNCDAVRIARAANCGWVALERLKEFVIPAVEEYEGAFAWAGIPKAQAWPVAAAGPDAASAGGTAGSGSSTSAALAAAATSASASGAGGSVDPAAAAAAAAAQSRVLADAAARLRRAASAPGAAAPVPVGSGLDGGEPERDCDSNVLKEFLSPDQFAEYCLSGRWPRERQPCILCRRAEDLSRLVYHMEASEDSVFALRVKQLPSHLDLEIPFARLPNLSELALTYGISRVGMKYDRALLGMKITDAMSLAKCIKATQTLTSLILQANVVNDKIIATLMEGLVHNQTITMLDLSHNEITARGVKLLCRALGPQSVMMSLDLSDNQIHSDGGKYLGQMLARNESLVDLNLRLNALDERGGRLLLEGLRHNRSLTSINLASNELCGDSVTTLAETLQADSSGLIAIDLSNNQVNDDDAAILARALRENASLTSLDLRNNASLSPSCEAIDTITRVTRRNEHSLRQLLR